MPIYPRNGGFQVQVTRADALEGFQKIRRQRPDFESAKALEGEIIKAIDVYGKWPVESGDKPLSSGVTLLHGTLFEAANLALATHWKGTAYEAQVTPVAHLIVRFMEARKKFNFEDITSEDLDAYVKASFEKGNTANTVNHHLSALSVINTVALERKPPLTTVRLPIKRVKQRPVEKWWLRPEDQRKACEWLRGQAEYLFADYIEILAYQGLRVDEGLRLRPRHVTGLDGKTPGLKVPGTKTQGAEATIPVFPQAVPIFERAIKRAEENHWQLLFPITWKQANELWKGVRALLGVEDVKTATLRAVRRSFAHYANERGMPTKTLQKVLRHETIATTDKYLQLVGGTDAEAARRYFETEPEVVVELDPEPKANQYAEVIAAFRSTGASPVEVAQFMKELMRA